WQARSFRNRQRINVGPQSNRRLARRGAVGCKPADNSRLRKPGLERYARFGQMLLDKGARVGFLVPQLRVSVEVVPHVDRVRQHIGNHSIQIGHGAFLRSGEGKAKGATRSVALAAQTCPISQQLGSICRAGSSYCATHAWPQAGLTPCLSVGKALTVSNPSCPETPVFRVWRFLFVSIRYWYIKD